MLKLFSYQPGLDITSPLAELNLMRVTTAPLAGFILEHAGEIQLYNDGYHHASSVHQGGFLGDTERSFISSLRTLQHIECMLLFNFAKVACLLSS